MRACIVRLSPGRGVMALSACSLPRGAAVQPQPGPAAHFLDRTAGTGPSRQPSWPAAGSAPGARRPASAAAAAGAGNSGSGSLSSEVCALRGTVYDVPGALAEELAELLLAEGAQSAAVEEFRPAGGAEQEIYVDTADERARVWDRCSVVAHFSTADDAAGVLAGAAGALGLGGLLQAVEGVKGEDWEATIRDSYQPTEVAPGLWIVPAWSEAPPGAGTSIILEPGLAFGTGDHPTTRLCLRWLREELPARQGGAVMDYGCGSGVLAVGALLLGAGRAVGTDIDSLAVRAARQNAELNAVSGRLDAYPCSAAAPAEGGAGDGEEPLAAAGVPEGARRGAFGLVVANILRGPLVALAPRLAGYAAPGAALGLSGILEGQAPAVVEAYSPWFEGFEVALDEGGSAERGAEGRWALVTARRRRG